MTKILEIYENFYKEADNEEERQNEQMVKEKVKKIIDSAQKQQQLILE